MGLCEDGSHSRVTTKRKERIFSSYLILSSNSTREHQWKYWAIPCHLCNRNSSGKHLSSNAEKHIEEVCVIVKCLIKRFRRTLLQADKSWEFHSQNFVIQWYSCEPRKVIFLLLNICATRYLDWMTKLMASVLAVFKKVFQGKKGNKWVLIFNSLSFKFDFI